MTTQRFSREPLLITIADYCKLTARSRAGAYQDIAAKEIEAVKVGRSTRIVYESVLRRIAQLRARGM